MRTEKEIKDRISGLTWNIGEIQKDIRQKSLAGDRALPTLPVAEIVDGAGRGTVERVRDQLAELLLCPAVAFPQRPDLVAGHAATPRGCSDSVSDVTDESRSRLSSSPSSQASRALSS